MTTGSFAEALAAVLPSEDVPRVATELGVSERTVRSWLRGERVSRPTGVFALERVAGVKPGQLSRHLGYVPAGAATTTTAAEQIAQLAAEEAASYWPDAPSGVTELLERVDPKRAARRGLQLELMRIVVEDFEAEHGPITADELDTARRELGLHHEQASA